MKIIAAVVPATGQPFQVEEVDLEQPRSDEILVRIVGAGMCHTDLSVRDRIPFSRPAVLGHEGAGVVEKIGANVAKVGPGDHVVLSFNSCGRCDKCLRGYPGYCQDFEKLNFGGVRSDDSSPLSKDGAPLFGAFFNQSSFANYALASERNAVKVPKDIPLEILGPLGCGVQTGAGSVLNALRVPAGTSIAVFGTGAVGLSAIMAAVVAGCITIIGIDIIPSRLEFARELGATHVINAAEKNSVEEIQGITGTGVNYSIDTTGVPAVYRQAIESLDLLGICGLVGGSPQGTEVSLEMRNILLGRSTRGIIEGDSIPQIFIPQMIELYKQGRFPFDKLIKFYPIEAINQAAEDSANGITVKPVLQFNINS
jgi:aryl-alcohol dehydrogenase